MISLDYIEPIIATVALVYVYFLSITVTGYGQAWFAKKMGDSTAEDMGYLSFNPLAHFDLFGLLALFLVGFGWSHPQPIDETQIKPRWYTARLLLIHIAKPLLSLILVIVSIILLIVTLGAAPLIVLLDKFFSHGVSLNYLMHVFPEKSSLVLVLSFLMFLFIFFNFFTAIVIGVGQLFRYFFIIAMQKQLLSGEYLEYFVFIGSFLTIFFLAGPLYKLLFHCIMYGAYGLGLLFGAF